MAGSSPAWRRVGLALFVVLLVALGRESAVRTVDFPVYHRVAREMLGGDYRIYPAEVFDPGAGAIPSHGFRYAPVIAFLMMPIGWLPLEAAAIVLYLLKLGAAAYVGAVIARRAGLGASARGLLVAAFLLVGGYVAEEFRYGNVHFLTVALMVYAFDAAESGRVAGPAFALALAIATKVTPLALLGYFAIRKRVAVCLATIAALVVLAALPALVVGVEENGRLLRGFAVYAVQKVDEADNYALLGALTRHLTTSFGGDRSHLPASVADLSPGVVTGLWLAGVAVLGLLGLAVVAPRPGDGMVRLLELSIVLVGMLLAAPHTQRRYLVSLYVPVAVMLSVLVRHPDRMTRRAVLLGVGATAASGTVLPLVFGGRRLALMYEAASPYFVGTLVLFGALVVVTARLKRAAGGQRAADSA